MSTRGQITIDRTARDALAIKPGMVAVQVVVDGYLEVYFIPARHRHLLFGVLPARDPVAEYAWPAIEERAARSIAADA